MNYKTSSPALRGFAAGPWRPAVRPAVNAVVAAAALTDAGHSVSAGPGPSPAVPSQPFVMKTGNILFSKQEKIQDGIARLQSKFRN